VKALLDQICRIGSSTCSRSGSPAAATCAITGLTGEDDERIWLLAKDAGFFIVTKDGDFLARAFVRGHPPQVVQVCLGNASTRQIAAALTAHLDDIERFVANS